MQRTKSDGTAKSAPQIQTHTQVDNEADTHIDTKADTHIDTKTATKTDGKKDVKPVTPIRKRLRSVWLSWLAYRLIALPVSIGLLHPLHPDIIGGIAWQLLWLIPAFILTPWMVKGTSPYALLVGSMLTLAYLGASGVVVLFRWYDSGASVIWVYIIDMLLLFMINYFLFVLLKRLPSMNGIVKD